MVRYIAQTVEMKQKYSGLVLLVEEWREKLVEKLVGEFAYLMIIAKP